MEDRIKALIHLIQHETGTRIKKIDIQWTGFVRDADDEKYNPQIISVDMNIAKEYKD